MPEATSTVPPTTPPVPPVAPPTLKASITIYAIEFRAMMEVMRSQLDQHTVILHQIQQHLGIPPPPQPDIPGSLEPVAPAKDATIAKAPI
uniref:Uncharacterized protein n=1 Tax=Vitis vinifera TaxID=29760 RepID=A5B433_VITVI|nr:hypothetical protein VITISV_016513 [Vitis vinifera]